MSDVITALKRLERAGAEDSRATQRLVEAAGTLGRHVAAQLSQRTRNAVNDADGGECLPRRYAAGTSYAFDAAQNQYPPTISTYSEGAGNFVPVGTSRETALAFARDIADGWLDELAAWLEARAIEAEQSAERLEAADAGGHAHTCLHCGQVYERGNGCETDADHDFALCPECVVRGVAV